MESSNPGQIQQMGDKIRTGTSRAVEYLGLGIGATFVIGLALLVLIYVIYHLYTIIMRTNLRTNTLQRDPIRVDKLETKTLAGNGNFSELSNGKEFSYSFWMYISEHTPSEEHKHVLSRGNNPIFMMDNTNNKLYALIATENNAAAPSLTSLTNVPGYVSLSIEYVPIQRWVFITLVVENEFATLFMDGEIYSVKTLAQSTGNKIVGNMSGDMTIGRRSGNIYGFDGIISKVSFANYALTVSHVRAAYASSPMQSTTLSSMGLPHYRLRSPIVRVDDVTEISTI